MKSDNIDVVRAAMAVRELLMALGQDVESEGLKDTPRRVAEMFVEQCTDSEPELDRLFQQEYDGMVIVKDIPFVSACQHHLVHYFGRAHVAYLPQKKRVLGLSKLARLVFSCSRGFTIQESVTKMIADKLYSEVEPLGVMVVVEAEHGCMSLRGARAVGSSTITSVVKGVFRDVPAARAEFLGLISKGGPR
jgi:GTP cyclohydrolase I